MSSLRAGHGLGSHLAEVRSKHPALNHLAAAADGRLGHLGPCSDHPRQRLPAAGPTAGLPRLPGRTPSHCRAPELPGPGSPPTSSCLWCSPAHRAMQPSRLPEQRACRVRGSPPEITGEIWLRGAKWMGLEHPNPPGAKRSQPECMRGACRIRLQSTEGKTCHVQEQTSNPNFFTSRMGHLCLVVWLADVKGSEGWTSSGPPCEGVGRFSSPTPHNTRPYIPATSHTGAVSMVSRCDGPSVTQEGLWNPESTERKGKVGFATRVATWAKVSLERGACGASCGGGNIKDQGWTLQVSYEAIMEHLCCSFSQHRSVRTTGQGRDSQHMWSCFILCPELFNMDETKLNPSGFRWAGWVKHRSVRGCAALPLRGWSPGSCCLIPKLSFHATR